MPYYRFRCPECAYEFQDRFAMADADGKTVMCPKCDHRGLERVYKSGPLIQSERGASESSSYSCPTCCGESCDLD